MIIDLRSDTVTKPTRQMLEMMMSAEVGDDVYGEDPTVNKLEEKCAKLFGMDAATFCPSGTMSNQIAINVLTKPCDEIICYEKAHIYKYEGGGLAGNSHVSVRLIKGKRGILNREDVEKNINVDDEHYPVTSVVALENTVVSQAGSYYSLNDIVEIYELCRSRGVALHLDGARIFNALVESGISALQMGKYFETISICLSKGLGTPVGSVLISKKKWAKEIRRKRKVFGGGMRQVGILAAAGIYALDNHVDRLKDDHRRAKELEKVLIDLPYVFSVMPVDTNIIIFELEKGVGCQRFLSKIGEHNIKALDFHNDQIRLVTHLDFDDNMLEKTIEVLKKISF